MDTFADDALVNDFSREFWGRDHIREFMSREFVGGPWPRPTRRGRRQRRHVVRALPIRWRLRHTGLPDPLIMTIYLRIRDGKIVTLFVIKNTQPEY